MHQVRSCASQWCTTGIKRQHLQNSHRAEWLAMLKAEDRLEAVGAAELLDLQQRVKGAKDATTERLSSEQKTVMDRLVTEWIVDDKLTNFYRCLNSILQKDDDGRVDGTVQRVL
jgi:hypothetical protein